MPILSSGNYDSASQISLLAVKAKTDLIGANVALESGGNVAAIKAKTDLIGASVAPDQSNSYIHIPLFLGRGVVVAGTWVLIENGSAVKGIRDFTPSSGGAAIYTTTNANGDEYSYTKIYLPAGDYSVEVLYYKDENMGIMDVMLGATVLGSIDQYAAAIAYNFVAAFTVTVAATGYYTVRFKLNGKNASASAYRGNLQGAVIWRRN